MQLTTTKPTADAASVLRNDCSTGMLYAGKLLLFLLLLSIPAIGFSQSYAAIKNDTETYLWGEGTGSTINRADQQALAMLISQISIFVESEVQSHAIEQRQNDVFSFDESFRSSVQTYSSATLNNTQQIVLSDEPNAKVFRYIKRAEIDRVFDERERKIREFVRYGQQACQTYNAGDALRYYYWALSLLRSHPRGNSLSFIDKDGHEKLLATWLHRQINQVFLDVNISLADEQTHENYRQYNLQITYKGKPAVKFDFDYWTGRNYASVISARQGKAGVEIMGDTGLEQLQLRAEYMFEGEAAIDHELRDVMQRIEPIPFSNNRYTVKLEQTAGQASVADDGARYRQPDKKPVMKVVADNRNYDEAMQILMQAIRNKTYASAKRLFTKQGYDIYTRILAYGNAIIISEPELVYMQIDEEVVVRALPMQFSFANNNRQFVENVVVHFNHKGLIDNITFSLDQLALNDVMAKDDWPMETRWILINFLENYKTAFALKRLDYIESIFDDEALIIIGNVVKNTPGRENPYLNNQIVRYNRYSKTQYIRNLRHAFNSNEFINIRFEDNIISKAGRGGEVYGIQIKQDYFSSNYGDTGYLFLMVDVNEPDTPMIHVRTWQPQKNDDGSIYGLADF